MKKLLLTLALITTLGGAQAQSLGDLLGKIGGVIESATATTNFAVEDLIGSWAYESPAVSMSSDNALSTVGGIAAGTTLENKLSPYFKKFGIDKLKLVVADDLTFKMTINKTTLSGTISKDGEQLAFNFKAFGKMSIGKINARATKSGTSLNLTFDAQRVIEIAQKISSLSGNSTLQSVNAILQNYKGVYVGAKLRKLKA